MLSTFVKQCLGDDKPRKFRQDIQQGTKSASTIKNSYFELSLTLKLGMII